MPGFQREMVFGERNELAVEFDKGGMTELVSSLAERAFGELSNRSQSAAKNLEERIQFRLQRPFEKINREENQRREG